ncbi:MAG: hypothetical protein V4714_01645 [Bacteroidota bacterium]
MKKILIVLFAFLAVHLTALAQSNSSNLSLAPDKESKKSKRSAYVPKDRSYWQDGRNQKKLKKKGKKNCDCPGEMTAKQRRKHHYRP